MNFLDLRACYFREGAIVIADILLTNVVDKRQTCPTKKYLCAIAVGQHVTFGKIIVRFGDATEGKNKMWEKLFSFVLTRFRNSLVSLSCSLFHMLFSSEITSDVTELKQ